MSAVRTLRTLLLEGRDPNEVELEELRRFPGWGATPELFDPKSSKYAADREALTELWSGEEWSAARRTVLNAHYTHSGYVRAMWDAVNRLGVPSDAHVLEPGCGTGNFIAAAASSHQVTGVELDPTTAGVARLLHPAAEIRNESFADTFLEHDGYDLAIGNVPFGQTKLHDPAYNAEKLSLHNHFIVKSLRQVKPGGIVAVMTSRWTMDAKSERARREIAKHGELLGAVRMPRGAHGEIAGTDAIIDVLVFRRHVDGPSTDSPTWLRTVTIGGDAGAAAINSYFASFPQKVLGDLGTRTGQFGPELTVTAPDVTAEAIAPQLAAALDTIVDHALEHGHGYAAAGMRVTDRPVARIVQDPARAIGRISIDELTGDVHQVGFNGAELMKLPKNAIPEVRQLVRIRDAAVSLLEAESATADDTSELADLRARLGEAYDAYVARYGPISRVSVTVSEKAGQEARITRRYPAAVRAFRGDPHFPTLAALEFFNEDTGEARKATIFERRVVGITASVDRVDSPVDAMRVSLDRVGHVDVPLVAELLDISETEVESKLGDLVFVDPANRDRLIPAEEFLSGNVRLKRKEMRELAAEDASFQRHLDALESVIPDEVGPAEIDVKLGASWVPVDDVSGFIQHALKKEVKVVERIDGEWKFRLVGMPSTSAEERWSASGDHERVGAERLFLKVLNGESLTMYYRPDPEGPRFVDLVGTEALKERAGELHEEFQDWLWSDGERSIRLQERYNDLFKGIVLRSYDGAELSFPGKAASFTPRPHQHAAVARMLAEPSTGLWHEVGAGKTAEMILGVMELKRLGMVTKPALIVPNHSLDQFTREFKQIYPRARVLVGSSDDVSVSGGKNARKLFVAKARSADWDAVILTHSAFEKIGLGKSQALYAQERLNEFEEILAQKLGSELSSKSVKQLEKDMAAQEEKLKRMLDIAHDEGVSWEETEIDYLCVDEAHKYKNLAVQTSVPDLHKSVGAQRATDLDMKLWYHRDHLGQSRVATLATATPIMNSMLEMYVFMRYLRPDLLREAEVYSADDWCRQFTQQVTAVEAKPSGGGFQMKTRTSDFRNPRELLRMWHVPGDVKTQADLNLPVPKLALNSQGVAAAEVVAVPATAAQQAGIAELIERAERVKDGVVDPSEDNMLKITANGRAIALDARLLGGDAPEEGELAKIDIVAKHVFTVWEENKDRRYLNEWGEPSPVPGALQLVFCDMGTPSQDGSWDAYRALKTALTSMGVPESQVRFIHEAKNDRTKAELFQRCRDGRVQVLIGSTEKMGVGTNVQDRCVAMHEVDAPWKPGDVVQRMGRGIRQRNQNETVQTFRYVTEGSFDSYMWGLLTRKMGFIDQYLSGRLDVDVIEVSTDMVLEFAEIQAIASGDMRLLEIANLKNETQKLSRQQRGHQRKVGSMQARRMMLEQGLNVVEHDVAALEKLAPSIVDTRGDLFTGAVQLDSWRESTTFRERKEFGAALRANLERSRQSLRYFGASSAAYPAELRMSVEVGGLDWGTRLRWNAHDSHDPIIEFQARTTHQVLMHKMLWSRAMSGELSMLSQGFESQSRGVPALLDELKARVASTNVEVHELRTLEQAVWPKQGELNEKQGKLDSLIAELESEAAALDPAPPAPPEHPVKAVQHHVAPAATHGPTM